MDKPKAGDVYMVNLPFKGGSIQNGKRPIIITGTADYDYVNDRPDTVVNYVPLTTKEKNRLITHYLIKAKDSCLREDSTVLAEQASSISSRKLLYKLGEIDNNEQRFGIWRAILFASGSYTWICNRKISIYKHIYENIESLYAYWSLKDEAEFSDITERIREKIKSDEDKIKSICISYDVNYEKLISDLYNHKENIIGTLEMLKYAANFYK